jgi:serine/threonine protein kinase
MKQYVKEKIILMRSLFSVMNELVFYKKHNLKSRFLVNINYAFQDFNSFYLIQEYCNGGDLRYHMTKRTFSEEKSSKFKY